MLPSIEHFQDRLLNPKMNYTFYQYFLRAVIGEARWKHNMQDDTQRMATSLAEAYAHSLIENNYFAWLFQYKHYHRAHTRIQTAYDEGETTGERSEMFTAKELLNIEITVPETEGGDYICIAKIDNAEAHDNAKTLREEQEDSTTVSAISEHEGHKLVYDAMNEKLSEFSGETTEQGEGQETKRKKRKLMRGLKIHRGSPTSSTDEDRSSHYNDNTNRFIDQLTKRIKTEVKSGKIKRFETVYKQLVKEAEEKAKENNKDGAGSRHQVTNDIYEEAMEAEV